MNKYIKCGVGLVTLIVGLMCVSEARAAITVVSPTFAFGTFADWASETGGAFTQQDKKYTLLSYDPALGDQKGQL